MLESNASIGGEQSGHIIISDKLPVGDGLLTLIYSLKALSFFKTTLFYTYFESETDETGFFETETETKTLKTPYTRPRLRLRL